MGILHDRSKHIVDVFHWELEDAQEAARIAVEEALRLPQDVDAHELLGEWPDTPDGEMSYMVTREAVTRPYEGLMSDEQKRWFALGAVTQAHAMVTFERIIGQRGRRPNDQPDV